ncbi:MAG: phytanoyl-CoA dioxygenase family protein [Acidobacteriota bacterium]
MVLTNEEKLLFSTQGYLLLQDIFSSDWLAQIDTIITFNIEQRHLTLPATSHEIYTIAGLIEKIPALHDYLCSNKIITLAKEILGIDIRLLNNQLIVKPPYCLEQVCWHRDCEYENLKRDQAVTFWFPFTVVHSQNGCLWYIPGSHLIFDDQQENANPVEPIQLAMGIGDLAIHSAGMLHRSGPNYTDSIRKALMLEFIKADAYNIRTGQLFEEAIIIR